jgi:hypothetical protein
MPMLEIDLPDTRFEEQYAQLTSGKAFSNEEPDF